MANKQKGDKKESSLRGHVDENHRRISLNAQRTWQPNVWGYFDEVLY